MTISVGTPTGFSLLQTLLQPDMTDASNAANSNNALVGLFQSNSGTDAATDPAGPPTTTTTSKKGGPLDPATIGTLFSLQSISGSGGTVQPTLFAGQSDASGDSPVDQTDPRHVPTASPAPVPVNHSASPGDGVSLDSSSFAQNAVSSPTSTAADNSGPSGAAATNVASNQNILLDQLIHLQKQLVTVANPILSTFI
jgi:hypothetical protein